MARCTKRQRDELRRLEGRDKEDYKQLTNTQASDFIKEWVRAHPDDDKEATQAQVHPLPLPLSKAGYQIQLRAAQ